MGSFLNMIIGKLTINGENWIVEKKQLPHWGDCTFDTKTIRISSRLNKSNATVTLIHEVIHALFSDRRKKKYTEEEVCEQLDIGLTRFLKENKGFEKML